MNAKHPPPITLEQPTVYIIDDDSSVCLALEDLLTSVGLQVNTYHTPQQFLKTKPHPLQGCLILDIRMPTQSGMDFHRQMANLDIHLPTIFITGHGDIAMSVEAMKNGAIDFLTKPFRDQDLLEAIHHGIEKDRLRRQQEIAISELRACWMSLTAGEQDVMQLVVTGLLNKQIAAQLNLSEVTVKVRRGQVMRKMHVKTLADLVKASEKMKITQ